MLSAATTLAALEIVTSANSHQPTPMPTSLSAHSALFASVSQAAVDRAAERWTRRAAGRHYRYGDLKQREAALLKRLSDRAAFYAAV